MYKNHTNLQFSFYFFSQLHAGDGLFVNIKDIRSCENVSFNMNTRVQSLLKAFYPQDFGERTLAPDRIKGKISEETKDLLISEKQVVVLASKY